MPARIFASHFGHLSIVFTWLAGMYLAGARYSNFGAWLDEPTLVSPGAQPVPRTAPALPSIVQDTVNGDVGGGLAAIQVTSGLFHVWRAQGFTSSAQLFLAGLSALAMALVCLWAGWDGYTLHWLDG